MNGSRIVGLVRRALTLLGSSSRSSGTSSGGSTSGSSGASSGTTTGTGRRRSTPRRDPAPRPNGRPRADRAPTAAAPAADSELAGARIEYSPSLDGDADPGEVVWTWVPYEDDPSQGKDRPVMIFGRRGDRLVGVALTSKRHDNEPQIAVGTGSWDREGRTSYAKLERILDVDPTQVRREGAVLPRARFDEVVDALRRLHGLVERPR